MPLESDRPVPVLAVSYAAKSTADEHDSIPSQQRAIRSRVDTEPGRQLVAEFAEANRSGWRGSRGPELEAAMARAVELADTHDDVELWVWHSSRLGRGSGLKGEARSLLEVFAHLRRRGVTLRSVEDDQFVTSPMLVGFAAEQAEKYSSDLSKWVTAGKERQWQRGDWFGGPIPDGYVSDGAKSLQLDAARAPLVRRIFERALQAIAPAALARELNADGQRTASGGPWTRRRVQDTLANPVYAGQVVRWRGTDREQRRPGRHPALVTEQELAAVAHLTAQRDRAAAGRAAGGRPSRRFLLAGLARCSRCGTRMYSVTSTYRRKDGTRRRTYLCGHVQDGTGLCDAPAVDAVAVDAGVLERLPRFLEAADRWLRELGSDRREAEARAWSETQQAEQRLRELDARVAALSDRYDHEATVDIYSDRAEAMLDRLVEARADRKRAQRRAERAAIDLDAVRQAIDGDEMAVAHRVLHDALQRGETTAVREFNLRLREHFDAFVVGPDANAVPIWKVELPEPLARHLAAALDAPDVAAYIERRIDELGLREAHLSETERNTHA